MLIGVEIGKECAVTMRWPYHAEVAEQVCYIKR